MQLGGHRSEKEDMILGMITPIAQWLGSANSCINPILYAFFNKKFRNGFIAVLKSKSCCGQLRSDVFYQSTVRRSTYRNTNCSVTFQSDNSMEPLTPRSSQFKVRNNTNTRIGRSNYSFQPSQLPLGSVKPPVGRQDGINNLYNGLVSSTTRVPHCPVSADSIGQHVSENTLSEEASSLEMIDNIEVVEVEDITPTFSKNDFKDESKF